MATDSYMAKMAKQLDLLPYSTANSLEDIKRIADENNRRLQDAYRNINDAVLFKEWLYFSVGMKRWRIGPEVGYHPGKERRAAVNFVIQELTGTDWRNQSHWQTQHVFWGGERDSE